MSKSFFLCNFVNFAYRDMGDTSMESYVGKLYFFFLDLRAVNNLWGRYDSQNDIKTDLLLLSVSFLHTE